MSSYKILSWPNMIMHTVGSTDIQSTTCSARGKQCCWQDGSSRQKINILCKISKSSYILLFDYGLWALPSNPVSQSILMILLHGLNRASFMWGSSVFNTHIERLWVEVGRRFVRQWHAFFMRLEQCHLLQRNNTHHCWLLHRLFLDLINEDCQAFCEEWNNHLISGLGEGLSPNIGYSA